MSKPKSLTIKQKQLIGAMRKYFSNISSACEECGFDRKTYYKWYEQNPEFRQQIDDLRMVLDDNIETKAIAKCLNGNGDTSMIQFMLETRMKYRGYVKKTEIEQTGELKIMQETSLDFSKLSVDELRELKRLSDKAKKEKEK